MIYKFIISEVATNTTATRKPTDHASAIGIWRFIPTILRPSNIL